MYFLAGVLVIVLLPHSKSVVEAYKAAVLEYHPIVADTPRNTILWNLHEYKNYASKAKQQSADIIVFPEYGLTGLVNNTKMYAVEVYEFSDVIIYLKGIAAEHQIYMVVNLLERAHKFCCDIPEYYSTTVVFDRSGTIVARYRKINLFNEAELTPGQRNQNNFFGTDFNVSFAILASHDVLFKYPSKGVQDVVCPTAWASTIPFYFSLSIQRGYALSNDVTMLVAGFNQPWKSFSGTGIYLRDGGVAEAFYTDSATNRLIVREVPNIQTNACVTDLKRISHYAMSSVNYVLQTDFHPSIYSARGVNFANKSTTEKICDGDFCCTFHIATESTTSSLHKLMVYDGRIVYDRRSLHVQICGLVSCETDSVDSCGKRLDTSTEFTKISVRGNFSSKEISYLPLALDYDLLPLDNIAYCQHNNTDFLSVELTATNQTKVFVFGFVGQVNCATSGQRGHLFLLVLYLLTMLWGEF